MRAAPRRRRVPRAAKIEWQALPADVWERVIASTRRLLTVFRCAAVCRESAAGMRALLNSDEGGLNGREMFVSFITLTKSGDEGPTFDIDSCYTADIPLPMALVVCQLLKVSALHITYCEEGLCNTEETPRASKSICTLDREEGAPILTQTGVVAPLWVPRRTAPDPTEEERIAAEINGGVVTRSLPINQGSSMLVAVCATLHNYVSGVYLDLTTSARAVSWEMRVAHNGVAYKLTAGATQAFLYSSFSCQLPMTVHEFIGEVPLTLLRPTHHHLASVMQYFLNKHLNLEKNHDHKPMRCLPLTVFSELRANGPADMVTEYCRAAGEGTLRKLSPTAVESNAKWLGVRPDFCGRYWGFPRGVSNTLCRIISPLSQFANNSNSEAPSRT